MWWAFKRRIPSWQEVRFLVRRIRLPYQLVYLSHREDSGRRPLAPCTPISGSISSAGSWAAHASISAARDNIIAGRRVMMHKDLVALVPFVFGIYFEGAFRIWHVSSPTTK